MLVSKEYNLITNAKKTKVVVMSNTNTTTNHLQRKAAATFTHLGSLITKEGKTVQKLPLAWEPQERQRSP